MLPGLAPTHKKVSVPFIVVVDFEGDKVCTREAGREYAVPSHALGDRHMHAMHTCLG